MNRIKAITGKTNWFDAPDITLVSLAAHKNRHATGGADQISPSDIGAASAVDLDTHKAAKASSTVLGHVKQGSGVTVDANGVISANVTSVAGKTGAVTLTKSDVGLSAVDNVKQMPLAGGTFTGIAVAQNNTAYTTKQIRNVFISTSDPSGGGNGDIWLKYA